MTIYVGITSQKLASRPIRNVSGGPKRYRNKRRRLLWHRRGLIHNIHVVLAETSSLKAVVAETRRRVVHCVIVGESVNPGRHGRRAVDDWGASETPFVSVVEWQG